MKEYLMKVTVKVNGTWTNKTLHIIGENKSDATYWGLRMLLERGITIDNILCNFKIALKKEAK